MVSGFTRRRDAGRRDPRIGAQDAQAEPHVTAWAGAPRRCVVARHARVVRARAAPRGGDRPRGGIRESLGPLDGECRSWLTASNATPSFIEAIGPNMPRTLTRSHPLLIAIDAMRRICCYPTDDTADHPMCIDLLWSLIARVGFTVTLPCSALARTVDSMPTCHRPRCFAWQPRASAAPSARDVMPIAGSTTLLYLCCRCSGCGQSTKD